MYGYEIMNINMAPCYTKLLILLLALCSADSIDSEIDVNYSMDTISPLIIMGLDSGELLRCKYDNATDCINLYEQDTPVYSLEILGEFVYLGLQSGELRRCPLPHPDHTENPHIGNCTTFHQLESEITGLAVSGKFLFASTTTGITKCGLRKSEDCFKFYDTDTPAYSLASFKDNIYIGLYNAIWTCPIDNAENCTVAVNTSSTVSALVASRNYLYAGLSDSVQICELENNVTDCILLIETDSAVKALDIFGNQLHTSLESGVLLRYTFDKNGTTTLEKNEGVALSLFTTYDTTPLRRSYRGENTGCTWQWQCPPYIVYYDIETRAALELKVKDNKLYFASEDRPFDTDEASFSHSGRKAIFVMDPAGRIYASNQHPIFLIHHSSLMNGMPVAAAGEIKADDGVIQSMTSCSGHYRPAVEFVKQVTSSLKRLGYTREFNITDCMRAPHELLIDLDYKKTDLYYKAVYEEYSQKLKK